MVIFNSARRQRQDQVQSISVLNSCISFFFFFLGVGDVTQISIYHTQSYQKTEKFLQVAQNIRFFLPSSATAPFAAQGSEAGLRLALLSVSDHPPTHPPGEVRNYEINFTNRFTSCNTYKFFKILVKSCSFLQFHTIS